MAAKNGDGPKDPTKKEEYQASCARAMALLSEEDAGRVASAVVLLATWNEARSVAMGSQLYAEAGRAEYHLDLVRKRLNQARRAGLCRAQGEWLDAAWENVQQKMWPHIDHVAEAEAADAG